MKTIHWVLIILAIAVAGKTCDTVMELNRRQKPAPPVLVSTHQTQRWAEDSESEYTDRCTITLIKNQVIIKNQTSGFTIVATVEDTPEIHEGFSLYEGVTSNEVPVLIAFEKGAVTYCERNGVRHPITYWVK